MNNYFKLSAETSFTVSDDHLSDSDSDQDIFISPSESAIDINQLLISNLENFNATATSIIPSSATMGDETSSVSLPQYNECDPDLWFVTVEAMFTLATPKPITAEKTMYMHTITKLPPSVQATVRDIITNASTASGSNPYTTLKEAILKRCGDSSPLKLKKLLEGERLGDRKPSELLQNMKKHASGHKVDDKMMKQLFLQNLPTDVQKIISINDTDDVAKLAEMADRILEISIPSVSAVQSSSVGNEAILAELRKLNARIDELEGNRGRSRSHSRNFDKPRPRSKSNDGLCWYHRRFGKRCQEGRCQQPCSWTEKEKDSA